MRTSVNFDVNFLTNKGDEWRDILDLSLRVLRIQMMMVYFTTESLVGYGYRRTAAQRGVLIRLHVLSVKVGEVRRYGYRDRPSSILEDGLLMIAALILHADEVKRGFADVLGCRDLPSVIDLSTSVTNKQHIRLINLSRKASYGWYQKLVIANFQGCSMINRVPVLERYGYDVELLTPFYTPLYSRWLNATVIKGNLSDIPELTNRVVIGH